MYLPYEMCSQFTIMCTAVTHYRVEYNNRLNYSVAVAALKITIRKH